MRIHPQSSSALDPRVHASLKSPIEIIVEQLRSLITVEPISSLRHVFISEAPDGSQIMTRRDLRAALNFCLPRPRQLHEDEYQIIVNYLDPDQTNFVSVQDFIKLFPKKPPCQCYLLRDISPGPVKSYSETSARDVTQPEGQEITQPKTETVAKPSDGKREILPGPSEDAKPEDTEPSEMSEAEVKLKVLNKAAQLISAVNNAKTDDGLDFFRKHMVDTLRKLDTLSQEDAKFQIEHTVYTFLKKKKH